MYKHITYPYNNNNNYNPTVCVGANTAHSRRMFKSKQHCSQVCVVCDFLNIVFAQRKLYIRIENKLITSQEYNLSLIAILPFYLFFLLLTTAQLLQYICLFNIIFTSKISAFRRPYSLMFSTKLSPLFKLISIIDLIIVS